MPGSLGQDLAVEVIDQPPECREIGVLYVREHDVVSIGAHFPRCAEGDGVVARFHEHAGSRLATAEQGRGIHGPAGDVTNPDLSRVGGDGKAELHDRRCIG